ncbi:hypothetical protein FHR83_003992 [Actinoplanes campanulatus]|uniref:Uncharacterized protein n=1 Tax=Actinoplanes campanulatus TaxID=113559 RepID=A0A7W5AHQ1_9ACTN|nr:hypothetical protein [Actinoplanes campanulatus]MBB3096322.1 hypothetical protein [Actinoplanes campanulatus]
MATIEEPDTSVDALLAEIRHADAGRHNDDTAVYLRWTADRLSSHGRPVTVSTVR